MTITPRAPIVPILFLKNSIGTIGTRVAISISYDYDHYTMGTNSTNTVLEEQYWYQ